jgi:hypothetical protein
VTVRLSYKFLLPAVAGLLALGVAATSEAHGSMKPQHGGVLQMSGETTFELVRSPAGVVLYVREDDEDVSSAAMSAQLTVTTRAGNSSNVQMVPAAGNRFEARGVRVTAGSKVGVMVIDKASKARESTTFTVN